MRRHASGTSPLRLAAFTLLIGISALATSRARAEGSALVIGAATYAGQPTLDGCKHATQDVADALRRRGLEVATSIDAPSSSLRNAIDDFAAKVASAPGAPAVIYVCAAADAVDGRVFLLPADVDLGQPVNVQAEGIVLRAALGTLAGANDMLVADLALRTLPNAQPIAAPLQAGTPGGAVLAVQSEPAKDIGALGRALAGASGDDWTSAQDALRSEVAANAHNDLAVFQAPMPPASSAPPAPPCYRCRAGRVAFPIRRGQARAARRRGIRVLGLCRTGCGPCVAYGGDKGATVQAGSVRPVAPPGPGQPWHGITQSLPARVLPLLDHTP